MLAQYGQLLQKVVTKMHPNFENFIIKHPERKRTVSA